MALPGSMPTGAEYTLEDLADQIIAWREEGPLTGVGPIGGIGALGKTTFLLNLIKRFPGVLKIKSIVDGFARRLPIHLAARLRDFVARNAGNLPAAAASGPALVVAGLYIFDKLQEDDGELAAIAKDVEKEIDQQLGPLNYGEGPRDTEGHARNINPATGFPYPYSPPPDPYSPPYGGSASGGSQFADIFNQPWFKALDPATQGLVAQTLIQSTDEWLQDPSGRVSSTQGMLNPDGSLNPDFTTYLARRAQTEASGGAINPSGLFNRQLGDQQRRLAAISGSNGIRDADGNVDQDFVDYLLGQGRTEASGGVVNPDGTLNDRFADFNTGQNYIGATEGLVDSAGALNPDVANFRTGLGYIDNSQGVLDRRGALNPDFANYNTGQNYIARSEGLLDRRGALNPDLANYNLGRDYIASSEGLLDREGGINPDLANYNLGRDYIGVGQGALDAQGRLNPDFADFDLDRITRQVSGGLSDQDVIAALRQSEAIDNPYALAWGWTNPLPENDYVPPWRKQGYEAHTPDAVERNFVPTPASQNYIPPRQEQTYIPPRQVQTYRPARFDDKTFKQPPSKGQNFKVEHLPESDVSEEPDFFFDPWHIGEPEDPESDVPEEPKKGPRLPNYLLDPLYIRERESEGGISGKKGSVSSEPDPTARASGDAHRETSDVISQQYINRYAQEKEAERAAESGPFRRDYSKYVQDSASGLSGAPNPGVPPNRRNQYRDFGETDRWTGGSQGGAPNPGIKTLVKSNPAVGNGGRNGLGPVDPSADATMKRFRDLLNRRKYGSGR